MHTKTPYNLLAAGMLLGRLADGFAQSIYEPYTFTTLAGGASPGSADGVGRAARFNYPSGVALDSAGNVYVADGGNNTIRKVTPSGVVTTLAGLAQCDINRNSVGGSADGTGIAARFRFPSGVAVDSLGNVYVADTGNHTIRKVTPSGAVTTLAGNALITDQNGEPVGGSFDGTGKGARFNQPHGVAVDNAGNVYVGDSNNNTIRKVTPAGVVTTVAGLAGNGGSADGTGSEARFDAPTGVSVDSSGNLYVADTGNHTIRKVTSAGVVTTLAGLAGSAGTNDGTGNASRFEIPFGVAVDTAGNVYVADTGNNAIRQVTPAGVVMTLAGLAGIDNRGSADGTANAARFYGPNGVAVDSTGNVYVGDTGNNMIRKVISAGLVTTLAGNIGHGSADGAGRAAQFDFPFGVAADGAGNVYVADTWNNAIRKVTPAGLVTTLAGLAQFDVNGNPMGGSDDGTGSEARFNGPSGLAVDTGGNVYVADTWNNAIRKVTPAGVVTTLAGLAQFDVNGNPVGGSDDGTGSGARFYGPRGVAVDSIGNVYVADTSNLTIRKVTPAGLVTTLAGSAGSYGSDDGTGRAAQFRRPHGVAVDSVGNVYVADERNFTIRKVTPAGVVTTLAGLAGSYGRVDGVGSAARFGGFPDVTTIGPYGVAVDSTGNVYVADTGNFTIRKVTPAGVVTTLGDAKEGPARFAGHYMSFAPGPTDVAVDSAGNVYVADTWNNTIWKGYPALAIASAGFSGGQFGFNLTGSSGQSVVVEASTDLVSWLPIWTNTFAGVLHFSDPRSGVYSNRFYRAHMP